MKFIQISTIISQGHSGPRKLTPRIPNIAPHIKGNFYPFHVNLVTFLHKLNFQTAGISSFLIQMLRYFRQTDRYPDSKQKAFSDRLFQYFLILFWHWSWWISWLKLRCVPLWNLNSKVNYLTQCHHTSIDSTSSQETIGIETILLNSNHRVVIYKR